MNTLESEPSSLSASVLYHRIITERDPAKKSMMIQDYVWKTRSLSSGAAVLKKIDLLNSFSPELHLAAITPSVTQELVDVALVTITAAENSAMRLVLRIGSDAPPTRIGVDTYWQTTIDSVPFGRRLSVVATSISDQRNAFCAAAVARLLSRYRIRLCVLAGIAGGVKGQVRIGDVVVANEVHDYEGAKMTKKGERKRSSWRVPLPAIRPNLEQYDPNDTNYASTLNKLLEELRAEKTKDVPVPPGSTLTKVYGIVSSGEKLVADSSLPLFRETYDDRIKAVDMESFGFAVACEGSVPAPLWAVFRGISDYGDPNKSDKYQPLAALAAISMAVDFVKNGYDAAYE